MHSSTFIRNYKRNVPLKIFCMNTWEVRDLQSTGSIVQGETVHSPGGCAASEQSAL